MNNIIPKPFRKQKNKIFLNFTMIDLVVLVFNLLIALGISLIFTNIVEGYIQLIIFIVFAIVFSLDLLWSYKNSCRYYLLIWRMVTYWATNKIFKKRNLLPYEKVESENVISVKDKFDKKAIKQYLAAIEIVGLDITLFEEAKINNYLETLKNVFLNTKNKISIVKVNLPVNLDEHINHYKNLKQKINDPKINNEINKLIQKFENQSDAIEFDTGIRFYLFVYAKELKEVENLINQLNFQFRNVPLSTKILNYKQIINVLNNVWFANDEFGLNAQTIEANKNELSKLLNFDLLKINKNCLTSGTGLKYKITSIDELPIEANFCWLNSLLTQNDATCIINLNHMKSDKVVSEFNKVITSNRVNFLTTKRSKHLQNQKQLYQMEKLDQLANDISIDLDSLKKSQIYFIQYDRDEKKLLKKVNLFQSWLKEKKIILNNLTFLQFEAFKNCNLGCNGGMTLNELQLPMSAFSYGYMFLTTKLNDPNGMFLGINNSNNVVFLDTFRIDENRKNHNIVVLGTSGSGKSTTVKKIVNDDLFNDRKVFIIDPESEYKCLSDKYDGFYVNFGSGQNGRINPLQITWTDEGSSSRSLMIDEHINFITSWIRTLYNQNTISERTLIMFKRVLKDFYTSLNFYDKQKIDINQLTKKDYPTFTDLIDYMETYKCLRDEEFDYKSLHTLLKDEFKDKQLYDGHSTLSVTNRINVFDLKNLFEKANPNVKQAQMLLMLNYIQQEINTNNLLEKDKKKQIRVVVDEAHLLIDKDNQNGLNFIFQMVKRIRKYNGSILIVTQNPNDFVGDETIVKKTTAIINNAQYSFIMNLSSNDVQAIDRLYKESGGLTQNEKNFIATARKGYGLLVSNVNERQIVSVELFDFEKEIFNLNYAS